MQSLAAQQHELINDAFYIFLAADTLKEELNNNNFNFHPKFDDEQVNWDDMLGLDNFGDKEAIDMLRVLGPTWLNLADSLTGNGTCGLYFQFPRSTNFFLRHILYFSQRKETTTSCEVAVRDISY